MKYSELFEPEPEKWGLRGDSYLWREMKEYFGDKEIPENKGELQHSLFKYCSDRCKISINMAETAFVEDYDKGGMSSGMISCKWWREIGLPLLFSRCNYEQTLYDFYYVFYKTEKAPGWNIAIITVSKGTTIEKKVKRHRGWIQTRIFGGTQFDKYYFDTFPVILGPGDMHLFSSWIYSLEMKKYFLPEEIIPIPNSKAKQNYFNYEVLLKDDINDDIDDLNLELDKEYDCGFSEDNKKCFSYKPIIKINDSVKIYFKFCDCFYELFSNLYHELKTNKFAFIKINEIEYYKFLFWDCGKTIRFKLQDYNIHTQVEEPVDIEIPKEEFFEKLNKMLEELQNNLDVFKSKFNRTTDTIGKITYKNLNYQNCLPLIKNNKWIEHDKLFENDEHKSIPVSILMDPNYKSIEEENEESGIHYYLDDDTDSIFVDINGKIHVYNYVEKGFIPCNIGVDIMKWHEFPASELHEIIEKKLVSK